MNQALVDQIAEAVLYEGYILYPYRPCVKNRQRWTFGGLFPRAWSQAHGEMEPSLMQVQCLIEAPPGAAPMVQARVRFLHIIERTVGRLRTPTMTWPQDKDKDKDQAPAFDVVDALETDERIYAPWQEAVQQEVMLAPADVRSLLDTPRQQPFTFASSRTLEPITRETGEVVGVLVRERAAIEGVVEWVSERVFAGCLPLDIESRQHRADAHTCARCTGHRAAVGHGFHARHSQRHRWCLRVPDGPAAFSARPSMRAETSAIGRCSWARRVAGIRCSPRRSFSTTTRVWRRKVRAICSTARRSTRSFRCAS